MIDSVRLDLLQPPAQPLEGSAALSAASKPQVTSIALQRLDATIQAKKGHLEKALASKMRRYNPALIGGNIFTIGYLALQGIQGLSPATASSLLAWNLVCGEIGGTINILVGIYCFLEGLNALRQGDFGQFVRLAIFDALALVGLGTTMILVSLSAKVAGMAAIGAFFAANPWLTPVFFLMLTAPLIFELLKKNSQRSELVKALKLDELKTLETGGAVRIFTEDLLRDPRSPLYLESLSEKIAPINQEKIDAELSKKLEGLQEKVQVEAALEIFKLAQLLLTFSESDAPDGALDISDIVEQCEKTEKALSTWKRALYVRFAQQLVYLIGFGVGMGASAVYDTAATLIFVIPNAIACYMDFKWPTHRNTPLIVAPVQLDKHGQCVCKECHPDPGLIERIIRFFSSDRSISDEELNAMGRDPAWLHDGLQHMEQA